MDPNPTATTMTNPRREIVHRGQLQRKVSQKYGTLFRKKKSVYEDELWVVLCVHDGGTGGIPHLEWYGELRFILEHRPLRVEDLLDCQYVNVSIGEERCLVIGFADKTRPVLELSAPSIEERKQWVDVLTRTLRRLNCLIESDEQSGNDGGGPRAENEYIGFAGSPPEPSTSASGIPDPERQNGDESPHVPLSPIPTQQIQALSMDTNGTATPTSSRRALGLKAPIPLMHSDSTCSTTEIIAAGPSTSSAAVESPQTRPIQTSTSLPSESSDRQHYSTPLKPKLTRQPVQQTPIAVAQSDEIERREEEEESPEPPPLPPRTVKNTFSLSMSIPRIPTSPIPSSPPQKLSQYDVIGQQPSTTALSSRSQYDQLCPPHTSSNGKSQPQQQQHQPYQQISTRFSSELSDHYGSSSRSSCSSARISVSDHRLSQEPQEDDPQPSAQYNFPSNSPIPRQLLSPEHIFRESLSRPRRICFWLALLAEHVAFVELREKVWIAGWNPKVDSNLRDILNFGDEVEQINGVELCSVKQLPEIYANIKPGVQIELTLRSNPRMKVFTLTKPTGNPKKELGIVLHRGKNKIASVELRSVADRAGISATMPAYYYHPTTNSSTGTLKQKKHQQRVAAGDAAADDRSVRAVISQLNGVPLSPFSRGDQFFHRIDQLPMGSPLNLTLLPADFCSLLARQLKVQLKDWRRFVHDM